ERLRAAVELAGLEGRAQQRDLMVASGLDHHFGDGEPLGDQDRGNVEGEEGPERAAQALRVQAREVGDLRLAEHLDAPAGQPVGVAGQDEAGAGDAGFLDGAVQPTLARQQLEGETLLFLLEELADGQLLHRDPGPFVEIPWNTAGLPAEWSRPRPRRRRSWLAVRDTAWSSAARGSVAAACATTTERPVTNVRASTA